MNEIDSIKERLNKIEIRNQKVEIDKYWETSKTRRALVAIFTYVSIGAYLWAIQIPNPWLNAIVPTFGFLLSTLTFPLFKKIWSKFN